MFGYIFQSSLGYRTDFLLLSTSARYQKTMSLNLNCEMVPENLGTKVDMGNGNRNHGYKGEPGNGTRKHWKQNGRFFKVRWFLHATSGQVGCLFKVQQTMFWGLTMIVCRKLSTKQITSEAEATAKSPHKRGSRLAYAGACWIEVPDMVRWFRMQHSDPY